MVKIERMNPVCPNQAAQDGISPPLPSILGKSTREPVTQVTVKQEKPEEETHGSSCCLDSFKVEDFSLECISGVQSKMLEEWKPEVQNIQSQDSNSQLSSAGLDQGKSENCHKVFPLLQQIRLKLRSDLQYRTMTYSAKVEKSLKLHLPHGRVKCLRFMRA